MIYLGDFTISPSDWDWSQREARCRARQRRLAGLQHALIVVLGVANIYGVWALVRLAADA